MRSDTYLSPPGCDRISFHTSRNCQLSSWTRSNRSTAEAGSSRDIVAHSRRRSLRMSDSTFLAISALGFRSDAAPGDRHVPFAAQDASLALDKLPGVIGPRSPL